MEAIYTCPVPNTFPSHTVKHRYPQSIGIYGSPQMPSRCLTFPAMFFCVWGISVGFLLGGLFFSGTLKKPHILHRRGSIWELPPRFPSVNAPVSPFIGRRGPSPVSTRLRCHSYVPLVPRTHFNKRIFKTTDHISSFYSNGFGYRVNWQTTDFLVKSFLVFPRVLFPFFLSLQLLSNAWIVSSNKLPVCRARVLFGGTARRKPTIPLL